MSQVSNNTHMNNKQTTRPALLWLPLAMAISAVIGIIIGSQFSGGKYPIDNDRKINTILNLISNEYVDTVNLNDLIESSIPQILGNLDPHSVYLPKEDLQAANDELNGSFCGVGISFFILNDTISISEVIPGGPSEKVGIQAGDRIVTVNDSNFVGPKINNGLVMKTLRGKKDTSVKLGIKRGNGGKILNFTVTRGDIPINSVDAVYMIDRTTGYLKINQFGRTTHSEFITGLNLLKEEGAKRYLIDLRGNGGGYMEIAIRMANEFLHENQLILFTKGREKKLDSEFWSDNEGQFHDAEVIVLMDEYSASASEIFAGAMQDNDRGLIVGRRSFGKGLVQTQIDLPDKSAIRLTIARYYTPSGRCIQKDYKRGTNYELEVFDRYSNGEIYNQDSIKVDKSQIFKTLHGRTVYGGGGIIPDVFVPRDTSGITSYYIEVANAGLIQKFAFKYVEVNRAALNKMKDYKQFLRMEPSSEALLNDFVTYAAQNGVPARWYYINQSRDVIVTQIKALVARTVFGSEAYYSIINRDDKTIQAALKAFNKHKAAYPISDK